MILKTNRQHGFTLMEIVMVMIIVGVILAMVIPRALRASTDAKFQLLRQECTELASWANEWAQRELEIQPVAAVSTLDNYMQTLGKDGSNGSADWIAVIDNGNNWQGSLKNILHRPAGDLSPSTSVLNTMPQNKVLKNPFNGLSLFEKQNLPLASNPVPGAIGCAWSLDASYNYYALVFLGTGSTDLTDFHAGMGLDLQGLRAGVYINRLIP